MSVENTGVTIAMLVASLFVASGVDAADEHGDHGAGVKCAGINSCKGTSACSTADNACKGQNACKGKGWLEVKSEKECKEKGGTVLKNK